MNDTRLTARVLQRANLVRERGPCVGNALSVATLCGTGDIASYWAEYCPPVDANIRSYGMGSGMGEGIVAPENYGISYSYTEGLSDSLSASSFASKILRQVLAR